MKNCITGFKVKEITTEYSVDEESGNLKIVKQKVNEKNVPPNTDIIKLIYNHYTENKTDYSRFTDEELEQEKQRLIKELKEKEDVDRNNKNKS